MKKVLVFSGVLVVVVGFLYLYFSFSGLPWKKASTTKDLHRFVEEKYGIAVQVKEPFYNFKDGSYGAIFATTSEPIVEFSAVKFHNGTMSDYYAESVWEKEATEEITPIMKQVFQQLTVENYAVNPVYGMGAELVKGKDIPSYKEIETGIDLGIHFNEKWSNKTEEALLKEGFLFITSLQEKGIKNIGIRLYLAERNLGNERTETFSISIDGKQLSTIQTEEDFKQFINIF